MIKIKKIEPWLLLTVLYFNFTLRDNKYIFTSLCAFSWNYLYNMPNARNINTNKTGKAVYMNCSNSEMMSVKFGMEVTSHSLWRYSENF